MKNQKSLGQHWLKDRAILDEIAELVLPLPSDPAQPPAAPLCLEIGPGLGTLTSALLRLFPAVLAVEYDSRLAENLPASFPGKNLTVINQDFLKFDLSAITPPYVVAGNIPYYITSPIITKLLTATPLPLKIVLLVQKEVAERLAAPAGRRTYLSVFAQSHAKVSLGPLVPKTYFTPPPKVDSAVVILEPHPPLLTPAELKFVQTGFSSPRKKLIKNLPQEKTALLPIFTELNLNPDARPSDLSIKSWKSLAKKLQVV